MQVKLLCFDDLKREEEKKRINLVCNDKAKRKRRWRE